MDQDTDQEDRRERREFWWSIFSVTVILGILGAFIYFGSINNQSSNQRVEPGVGAGPGEITPAPMPSSTPSPAFSPSPTPSPSESPSSTPMGGGY